jgi:hypothetical protein
MAGNVPGRIMPRQVLQQGGYIPRRQGRAGDKDPQQEQPGEKIPEFTHISPFYE